MRYGHSPKSQLDSPVAVAGLMPLSLTLVSFRFRLLLHRDCPSTVLVGVFCDEGLFVLDDVGIDEEVMAGWRHNRFYLRSPRIFAIVVDLTLRRRASLLSVITSTMLVGTIVLVHVARVETIPCKVERYGLVRWLLRGLVAFGFGFGQ